MCRTRPLRHTCGHEVYRQQKVTLVCRYYKATHGDDQGICPTTLPIAVLARTSFNDTVSPSDDSYDMTMTYPKPSGTAPNRSQTANALTPYHAHSAGTAPYGYHIIIPPTCPYLPYGSGLSIIHPTNTHDSQTVCPSCQFFYGDAQHRYQFYHDVKFAHQAVRAADPTMATLDAQRLAFYWLREIRYCGRNELNLHIGDDDHWQLSDPERIYEAEKRRWQFSQNVDSEEEEDMVQAMMAHDQSLVTWAKVVAKVKKGQGRLQRFNTCPAVAFTAPARRPTILPYPPQTVVRTHAGASMPAANGSAAYFPPHAMPRRNPEEEALTTAMANIHFRFPPPPTKLVMKTAANKDTRKTLQTTNPFDARKTQASAPFDAKSSPLVMSTRDVRRMANTPLKVPEQSPDLGTLMMYSRGGVPLRAPKARINVPSSYGADGDVFGGGGAPLSLANGNGKGKKRAAYY